MTSRQLLSDVANSVSSVLQINPAKMKGMSKKQLRSIKKTSVNKFGQVQLVDVYNKA